MLFFQVLLLWNFSRLWKYIIRNSHYTSLTPRACSNSCSLTWWCYPTISSSVVPFSSYLRSFPASGSFPMSQFFVSGGQSIGASASVLPMNIQHWSPLGLTGWISLQFEGLSRVFSNTTVQKHQSFDAQLSLWSNSHIIRMTTGKTIALTRWTFVAKVMSLLFNTLSRLVIAFFMDQASFNFMAVVTICSDFGAPPKKSVTVSTVSPSICHEVMGQDAMIFVFWMLSFKPTFSLSSFTLIRRLFSSSSQLGHSYPKYNWHSVTEEKVGTRFYGRHLLVSTSLSPLYQHRMQLLKYYLIKIFPFLSP